MNSGLKRLFHIYQGEERNALLFASLGFLWALAVTAGQKFADALFLLHVGASSLPYAYVITASVMIVLAAFMLRAFNSINISKIFIFVLSIGVGFYALAHLFLIWHIGTEQNWLWFALKVFGSLLFALAVTCFWTFIDQYYHLQDAKRLYSLFTSAIFLGIATTGLIMRSGLLNPEKLTLFVMFLLLVTIFWISRISKQVRPVYDEEFLESSGSEEEQSYLFLFKTILQSRFTLFLMASNFLTYVFLVITEYSYLSAFDNYFAPGVLVETGEEQQARLTLFLGQMLAGVSILNLIIGLFIYSRLVRQLGVNNLILFTPTFLLLTYSGWSLHESLIFPIMGFITVEGFLYVIDDNNFTLLLNAVPQKVKYKIRLIIESFFEPVGMLVSSLLITFVPISSIKLGLILSGMGLVVALLLRGQYLKAIFLNLSENAIHFKRSIRNWFKPLSGKQQKTLQRRLLAMVHIGDDTAELFAMESLLSFAGEKEFHKLQQFVEPLSANSKIAYLNLLSKSEFAKDPIAIKQLKEWLNQNIPENLKSEIYFYLARFGFLAEEEAIQLLRNADDPIRQGAAILTLYRSEKKPLASDKLMYLIGSVDEAEVGMAIKILGILQADTYMPIVVPFLQSPSLSIHKEAAAAIALMANPEYSELIPILIEHLRKTSDTDLRQAYLRALGNISDKAIVKEIVEASVHFRPNESRLAEQIIAQIGSESIPILVELTKDTTQYDRCRLLAGRILGRIALPTLRENLYAIVHEEIERAYFYYYHHHTIQSQHPDIDLSLLQDDLLSSFHSVMDFILQLLTLAGESEDTELLSRCLRSPNPKIRSQVIETLEKTCEPQIFRTIYPLIADLPIEEKLRLYLKSGRPVLSLKELLDKMNESSIQGDQLVAIALKYRLNFPDWKEALKSQLASKEEIIYHFAKELVES